MLLIFLSLLSIGQGDYLEIFDPEGIESLIDPVNFAFAIWGPIFLFLILYLGYQARDLLKSNEKKIEMPYVEQVSVFFVLVMAMAGLWYVTWLNRIVWLSVIAMIFYLIFLLSVYLRLNINRTDRSIKEKLAIDVPWSMHTAWITAATIISITTFLVTINFNIPVFLLSDIYWAVIVLIVVIIIYITVLLTRSDYIFGGVGIWVFFGILIERISNFPINMEVVIVALIGMIILGISIVFQIYRQKKIE